MNYELKLKNIIIKNNNPGKFGVICFNEFIIPINKESAKYENTIIQSSVDKVII